MCIRDRLCIHSFPALTNNRNTSWNIYERRCLCINTVDLLPNIKFTYFPYHSSGTGTKKRNSCFSMSHMIEGCWKPFNVVSRCINNTTSFYWRRKVCTLTSRKRRYLSWEWTRAKRLSINIVTGSLIAWATETTDTFSNVCANAVTTATFW